MQRLNEISGWLWEKISRIGQRLLPRVLTKAIGHSAELFFTIISGLLVPISTVTEFPGRFRKSEI